MELNIDATNAIVGRLGTYAAKQALLGYTVNIFNAEKAVVSGNPLNAQKRYHQLRFDTGKIRKGPYYCRLPDRFLRRMIRGMVGHKTPRGSAAYKRIMCYIGVPEKFKDKKLVAVAKKAENLPTLRYQTVGTICRSLGGKV